jgi:Domain of unknown function (DUF4105)
MITARRIGKWIGLLALAVAIAVFAVWGALAIWYRLPGPSWMRGTVAAAFALAAAACALQLATPRRWRASVAFAILAVGLLGWWQTIRPPAVADFASDVARQVTGRMDGNQLTLEGVRNFAWRTETSADERWDTRRFDLAGPMTLDLFLSTWDESGIAHMIMSFGFADGRHLAWSVEVKRLNGSVYSPIASAFKENALVLIAADERDVIGLRTNIRGEDVRRYRLNLRQETIRSVLTEFVSQANSLAATPRFYNSLTTNCTTTVVAMMRATGASVPLDWRLLVNSRLPDYAFDHDALEEGLKLAQAKAKAPVSAKGKAHGLGEGFSEAIRR